MGRPELLKDILLANNANGQISVAVIRAHNTAIQSMYDHEEECINKIESTILDVQEKIERENGHIVLLQSHRRRIKEAIAKLLRGEI